MTMLAECLRKDFSKKLYLLFLALYITGIYSSIQNSMNEDQVD